VGPLPPDGAHWYKNGPAVPVIFAVAEPLLPPKQVTSFLVKEIFTPEIGIGNACGTDALLLHKSVTVLTIDKV
jgi:hypothetical protein